ncbi:hypothetical protein IP92_05183 [Pseudoduganella flava]|uniref:YCII-related domain-containing protein n=1 Tax=Pseudoduganella flava TaxID=871742 RepID=A0A562PEI7_9BURK|nr:YciI family protein [Pseudoduganella flava]QGZ38794.1 hypothetical protein GO485_06845 [Pseudoduganella flava]TWI42851.1 hypothetical protein IP92_05183 [Pseudoduganella flava]
MAFMVIRRGDASLDEAEQLARSVPDGRWLHPSSAALRMTRAGDIWQTQEGPFPADETVAGFAIVDAPSQEAALAWAQGWPTADAEGNAVLEVRETGCPGGCHGVDSQSPAHLTPYAVLIRSCPKLEADMMPAPGVIERMNARNAADAQAGVLLAGDGLKSTAKGARVKFKGGRATVVDGPFTEIKELIAGFWLIQAASRDEAIAWIKSYPFPWPDAVLELREVIR